MKNKWSLDIPIFREPSTEDSIFQREPPDQTRQYVLSN